MTDIPVYHNLVRQAVAQAQKLRLSCPAQGPGTDPQSNPCFTVDAHSKTLCRHLTPWRLQSGHIFRQDQAMTLSDYFQDPHCSPLASPSHSACLLLSWSYYCLSMKMRSLRLCSSVDPRAIRAFDPVQKRRIAQSKRQQRTCKLRTKSCSRARPGTSR